MKDGKFATGGSFLKAADHLGREILSSTDVDGFVKPTMLNPPPCRARNNIQISAKPPQADHSSFIFLRCIY